MLPITYIGVNHLGASTTYTYTPIGLDIKGVLKYKSIVLGGSGILADFATVKVQEKRPANLQKSTNYVTITVVDNFAVLADGSMATSKAYITLDLNIGHANSTDIAREDFARRIAAILVSPEIIAACRDGYLPM